MSRFLVVSYAIPDRASGTPVVIRKFLQNFKSDEVVLIGRPTLKNQRIQGVEFDYPTLTIPTPPVEFRGERFWRILSSFFGVFTGLLAVFRYHPKAILAFYRDESSLLIGYWLHRITKIPLYSYFCDLYLENYSDGFYRILAKWLQPRIFKHSKKVIVLTEGIKDYYQQTYALDTIVIPHCNNSQKAEVVSEKPMGEVCNIGYLGSINVDRVQSLQVLCAAIKDNFHYQLKFFSTATKEYLHQHALDIQNSSVVFIPDDEQLLKKLSSCDILFLPLTVPEDRIERNAQVLTGFPTKVIDYLQCQVPILVHGNNETYSVKFFETNKCGFIVQGGADELLSAIAKLESNLAIRKELIKNSSTALAYFNGSSVANSFRVLLNSDF